VIPRDRERSADSGRSSGSDDDAARSGGSVGSLETPSPTDAALPEPRGWRTATARVLLGMACGALIAAIGPVLVLRPYLRDDRALDLVVRVVALDWRDFGEDAARERLAYELDRRGIGAWVGDDDCALTPGHPREVRCAWEVDLAVPGTDLAVPLAFASRAQLTDDGDVR
jgi:hypothetical protein